MGHSDRVFWSDVAPSARGQHHHLVATAAADGLVKTWNVDCDTLDVTDERTFQGHADEALRVVWHPDRSTSTLASGGADGTVRLWNHESQKPIQTIECTKQEQIYALMFCNLGNDILVGYDDVIDQFDLTCMKRVWSFKYLADTEVGALGGPRNPDNKPFVFDCDVSSDLLAVALSDGSIRIQHPNSGADSNAVMVLKGHQRYATSCKFVPREGQTNHLASCSGAGEIFLWDLRKPDVPIVPFQAHTSPIYGLGVVNRGVRRYVVSWSSDNSVRFWSLDDVLFAPSHAGGAVSMHCSHSTTYPVFSVATSEDGRFAAVCGGESTGGGHSSGDHGHSHGEHGHSHGEHGHSHGEHGHSHGEHSHSQAQPDSNDHSPTPQFWSPVSLDPLIGSFGGLSLD